MAESRRKGIRLVIILCVAVAVAVAGILIWTSRRAKVTFASDNGYIESMSVAIGDTIDQPKDPKPKDMGYSFAGWYSDPNYVTEFDFDLPIKRDTTIYVKWVEKTFTATVLRATNSGAFHEVLWSSDAKYKSSIDLPTKDTTTTYQDLANPKYNFQRANQTFLGFAKTDNGSGNFHIDYAPGDTVKMPAGGMTLYAIFRGEASQFIFNPNIGAEGEEKEKDAFFNEYFTVPQPEGLTKKYHSFLYWCTNADGLPRDASGNILPSHRDEECENVYVPTQQVKVTWTEPMTLFAIWERNKVEVGLYNYGAEPADEVNTVDAGLEGGYDLSNFTVPTRPGYRLMEYNTSPDGNGTAYAIDGNIAVEEEDIRLYSIWQRILAVGYTLNNNKVNDNELPATYADFEGIEGESFTILGLPASIEIPNFEFLGWSLDPSATAADYHANDVFTLYERDFENVDKLLLCGVWRGDSRTLRLENTADNTKQEIVSYYGRNEKITSTPVHTDSNYKFVGWGTLNNYDYKHPDNYTGTIYTLGQLFEMGSNQAPGETYDILYSLWEPETYTVTYYLQGGQLAVAPGQDIYDKGYVYKEKVTLYSQATKDGYRFMGWGTSATASTPTYLETEDGKGFTIESMPGNSFPLYAIWSKEYTITFYNNHDEATGLVAPITKIILGETFTIPSQAASNALILANYTVVAWSTQPEGGTEYAFDSEVTLEQSDMISFYAVWKGNLRTIEIYDGITKITSITGDYGQDIPLAIEEDLDNADPGLEIGGFYMLLKTSPTADEQRFNFDYGSSIRTTGMYFRDENGQSVETIKVYIVWNKKYFNVSYELNGGIYNGDENDDMSSYRIYDQYTNQVQLELQKPTKERYEFLGWTEDPENGTNLYAAGAMFTIPARDVTLYAYWARIYTITYNSNGGTLDPNLEDLLPESKSKGSVYNVKENVYLKTNYTFKTWNSRADGQGENYALGTSFIVSTDITLYAIWQGQEVQVTLLASDPGDPSWTFNPITISPFPRYGDVINLNSYASRIVPPNGLTLKGWSFTQPSALDVEVDQINDWTIDRIGAQTLHAVWAPKSVYFVIGLAGGIYNNSYNDLSKQVPFRSTVSLAEYTQGANVITKEGYRLIGFSYSVNAAVEDVAVDGTITMPHETVKLYCMWKELAVFTFDKNCEDADLENYVFEGIANDPLEGQLNLSAVHSRFTRDNYTLVGWSTSASATTPTPGFSSANSLFTITSNADMYLYAIWEGRTIYLTLNSNGSGGSRPPLEKKYGDVIDLTESQYQLTHYDVGFNFGGWSLTSGENNNNGAVGTTYTVSTSSSTVDAVTLYAIWNKNYFNVTYNYGDSTLGKKNPPDGFDSQMVQYTNNIDVSDYSKEAVKRLGYRFLGWAESKTESDPTKIYGVPTATEGVFTNLTLPMPAREVTLYATWEEILVPVIYRLDPKYNDAATYPDFPRAQVSWIGTSGNTSYTQNQLYQLSFKLPTNEIDPDKGVRVTVPAYRFVGWIVQGDTRVRSAGEMLQVNVDSSLTLLAQFEPNIITVILNANGGIITEKSSSTASYSVRENSMFTLPQGADITRGSHRLVSYTVKTTPVPLTTNPQQVQITSALIMDEDLDSNTVRITANWIRQITIHFNANGTFGESITGSIDDVVLDAGTTTPLPNCTSALGFQRPHYTFNGWNTEPDGSGYQYAAGTQYQNAENITLYAQWLGEVKEIIFNYATNRPGVTETITPQVNVHRVTSVRSDAGGNPLPIRYGDKISFSSFNGVDPTNDGWKLDGWTDVVWAGNATGWVTKFAQASTFTVVGDGNVINLYAVWTERSYQVYFNPNGGVFADGTDSAKLGELTTYNHKFTIPTAGTFLAYNPDDTRYFYNFKGWSTNPSFDYTESRDNISDPNTFLPSELEEPQDAKLYKARTATSTYIDGFKMPNRDVTLYAVWEPIKITVVFYYNPEKLDTPSKTVEIQYGDTLNLPSAGRYGDTTVEVTLKDHNFDRWEHRDADKTTVIQRYVQQSPVKIFKDHMTETEQTMEKVNGTGTTTIVFVATWIPQTVYIQVSGNGGVFTGPDADETRFFESAVGRPFTAPLVNDTANQIVYVNYALVGYCTNSNGVGGYTFLPGETITIPELDSAMIKEEIIEIDGEDVSTYVLHMYAQWVEAEAFIYYSDVEDQNPYFATVGEAVASAKNGDFVKIIKDCFVKSTITIDKTITIGSYMNEFKIYRYIDPDETNTFKGKVFNITTTGVLLSGEDADALEGYSLIFDGGIPDDENSLSSDEYYEPYFTVSGVLRLYNGVIVQNCSAENGAAVYISHNNASADIKYATFRHNFASSNGAAIYVNQAAAINMLNVKFLDNSATNKGGAVYTKAQTTIKTCLFERNIARNSSGGGGAVYNDATTISEEGSTYNQNSANGMGGAIYNAGITYIKNSVFTKNKAITSGGAVYNASTTSLTDNMQVTGATFGSTADDTVGNMSNNYGGALTNLGKITIATTTFANNTASHGGALSTDDASSVTALKNSTFASNKAINGSGGAIVVLAGIVGVGEAGVTSSTVTFVANTVNDGKGHALAVTGTATVNIYTAKFSDHVYEGNAGDGGIIYQNQGSLIITNAEVSANRLTNGYGGGLKISGGKCTINDILITGNTAKYGGGIAVSGNGNLTIKTAEIYQNVAVYGGGIYIQDKNSKVSLTYSGTDYTQIGTSVNPNTTIDADGETPAGGGIYNAGELTIDGALIQSNISAGNAGGIYNAATGVINLVSGQIRNNVAKYHGGAIYSDNNGVVKFAAKANTLMNVEGNLCGEGNYPTGNYTGSYFANGIYISNTKVIISGYMTIGMNGDGTILNDIFLSQRVGDLEKPTKIVEYSLADSAAPLNENTRICIASNVAIMGDKLVKFPSMTQASANLPKFSFAGDDAGFRVKGEYLVLGNYAAVIVRSGTEVYFSSLTEAYMDAAEGENIIVYKNVKLSDDLAIFNEKPDLATRQGELVAAAGVASADITSTFYITKKVTFTAGAEYTIYRGTLEGDLFTVVGGGRLTLGEDSPKDGAVLTISGQPSKDETTVPDDVGSLINVGVYVDSFFTGDTSGEEIFQLTVNKGAKLTKNKTAVGAAINSVGKVKLMGGEITGNTATHTDGGRGGAVHSSGYLYITGAAKVTKNKAYYGGGIYIANADVGSVALLIDNKTAEISSNEAEFAGGGIYVYSGKVRIKACLIEKNKAATTNQAGYGGGAIYIANNVDGSELTIASERTNWVSESEAIRIRDNHSATNGGGIVVDNAQFTFTNGYIQNNMADAKGGAIVLMNSAGLETPAAKFTTNNTSNLNFIINNEASAGGAIANLAGIVDLYYVRIYGNKAYSDGGAIYNESIVYLNNGTNIGISGEGGANEAGNEGGGIYNSRLGTVESKTATSYIAYNKASKFGGGAVNYGTFLFTKTLQFNNNSADSGAGIANIDSNAVITFQYSQFYANTAKSREMGGGAIYNSGTINFVLGNGSPTIGGSAANANKAFNGGAIYNAGTMNFRRDPSVTTHHGLYISYNEAEIYGGGIYNTGSINYYRHDLASQNWWIFALQNNKTTAARSGGGGGLCNNGGTINSVIFEPAITDPTYGNRWSWSTFLLQNNQTNGYGGGILLLDGTINAVNITYQNNVAQIAGGGLAIISGVYTEGIREKTTEMSASSFTDNTAPLGNAIYTQVGLTFNARLSGTIGLYLANARSYITFNTVAGNDKVTYYATDLDITVDSIIDGRRVAKFGMYNKMEDQDGDGVLDEVTVYHADDHFMKMAIQNNVDGWGLTVDEFGYVIISEPVAQILDTGRKYATLAEAAAAADADADIAILKSHTVSNQVITVDKTIEWLCSTNIILTASKKIGGGSAMFLVFTTQTDLKGPRTSLYHTVFNPSKSNHYGSNWGAAAGVRLTLDGNRSQYKYNQGSVSAIQVRSGAYYNSTQKPVQTVRWSTSYNYGDSQEKMNDIYVNKAVVQYKKVVKANGNWVHATNYGVKIHQQPAISSLTVHNTDIINFQSSYQGGINAILYTDNIRTSGSSSAILTCNNVNFENNRTTSYCDNGDTYTYGFSSNGAAALGVSGGRVELNNCVFHNNWACRTAGAVDLRFQQYNANKTDDPVKITGCTFTENKACGGRGGAIMINAVQGRVKVSSTQFIKNEASEGAAITYNSSTTTIFDVLADTENYPITNATGYGSVPVYHVADTSYNSKAYLWVEATNTFTSNLAKDVDFYGTYPATGGSGGAIYANNNIRIYGAVFTDNVAKSSGGAIYFARYGYFDATAFNNNTATGGSGGAICASAADIKYFNNIKANGNTCKEDGGALYLYGRSGTLSVTGTSTVFENNTAKRGGAIWYYRWRSDNSNQNESKVQVEIINGTFTNNSADTYGGAFYFDPRSSGGKSTGGNFEIQDLRCFIWDGVVISNNRAGQRGGGVYAINNLILYNVQILDNVVYASSSNGGGGGVYVAGYLNIVRGTITGNKLTGEGASGMGGGGVKVENKLAIGRGYSTTNVSPNSNANKRTIGETYAFSWEGNMGGSNKTRTSDGATMYLTLNSPSNELLRIEENMCESEETGLSNGQGTGVYAHSNIYFEGELGITDQVFFTSRMYLSSTHIYFKATIQFYYGGTPTENAIAIERCSSNNLISSEISLFNINNPGWTFAWGSGTNSGHVVFKKSTLNIAVYAEGWDTAGNAITGAKCLDGRPIMNVSTSYGSNVKIIYDQVVPYFEGYSFYRFRYFKNNDKSSTAYNVTYNYSGTSSDFTEANLKARVPALVDGEELELYVIWQETTHKLEIRKWTTQEWYSSRTEANTSEAGAFYYSYQMRSGESMEKALGDFEDETTEQPNAKHPEYRKQDLLGWQLSYYIDTTTKKLYSRTSVYPYPGAMTLRAVYVKKEFTLTFQVEEGMNAQLLTDKNVIKVKYGNNVTMLSGNLVSRPGYKVIGWEDNLGNPYNLNTNYNNITSNLTLVPRWQSIPFDLRVYYNYPTGGSSFLLYAVNAGDALSTSLNKFAITPEGYTLNGFATDAAGDNRIESSATMPGEDMILYAQWAPNTVILKFFDINNNIIDAYTVDCLYGDEYILPDLPATSTIKLWENLGSGVYYTPGSSFLINSETDRYLMFYAVK